MDAASCEPFEAAGWPTQRTKASGEPIVDGYAHGLGHGVGLDTHERPNLGRLGDPLVAGDVLAVETRPLSPPAENIAEIVRRHGNERLPG